MPDRIKVLHIIKSLGRGGAEMLIAETLALHDRSRFDFHCIYFLPWKNQLADMIESAGGKVRCIPAGSNIQILMRASSVENYIRQEGIDLLHAHLPWAGFVGRILHKKSGIPLLYTEHNKQERYNRITYLLNRITFGWQSGTLAVSADVGESIRRNIGPMSPVRTLLNGVNTSKFIRNPAVGATIRARLGVPQHSAVVGTVAVFRFQKRLKEWLVVAKSVISAHPDTHFIIVGDGPLRAQIEQTRNELDLGKQVHLVGLQQNVIPWLSAIDIFMMTSVFEGLPVALLEAMSAGCAVAATDAGGIKEVVRKGAEGILVGVNDWELLGDEVSGLIDEPSRIKEYAHAARSRVENEFSLVKMVRGLEEIYEEMIAESKLKESRLNIQT